MNIIGQIFGSSGYANHTRYLANELNKLIDCKLITNLMPNFERLVNDRELEMIKKEPTFDINLIITHPSNWRSNLFAKRNFVYLIWEGDSVPEWIIEECLNFKIEKIICPSTHTYDAIFNSNLNSLHKKLLKDKLVVIPHGVDLDIFKPLDIKLDRFTFLMNKGLRNLQDRGGIQYGIKAYLSEFSKRDNSELIVKINPAYGIPNIEQMFPDLKRKDGPRVKFIIKDMTSNELNELYNSCNVFVSPTRSEAFNIPCLEALACGKPVITTNFGGQTDFINNDVGTLINYNLEEVKHELEYEGVSWATPDLDHLKKVMRDYYKEKNNQFNKELTENCIKQASSYTWENTAKQIKNLI